MIQCANVTKWFGDKTALENLSCCVPEGCVYGMVGANGAGKSTLLRLITGVYRPNSGASLKAMARFYGDIFPNFSDVPKRCGRPENRHLQSADWLWR
ncbi:MAG: ATP-binding cassette domain-containing protein [Oscillospiraceae bacterium]|nr:ATP-binding cassette domain-containing protein [Oscillospiraceae bacterium]